MLKHLSIKNYALIQELDISPSDNLNIVTGETGAGKSIMLGAVGLLLGKRADTKALLNDQQKCIVEGHFDLRHYQLQVLFDHEDLDYEAVTIIRREITPSGKSRAFVNDTPVTLDILKKLGVRLIDVHSQHETLQLGKNDFQLKFIDAYAGSQHLCEQYLATFKEYKKVQAVLHALTDENKKAVEESDYNQFLLDELSKMNLQEDEQENLEKSVKRMEHAEEIKTRLNESLHLLHAEEQSLTDGLQLLRQSLRQLAKFGQNYEALANRVESIVIDLNDVADDIAREEEHTNFDPEQAQEAQNRLSDIYRLQQKHGVLDITALLDLQRQLESKVSRTQSLDQEISEATAQVNHLFKKCDELAAQLSSTRQSCFDVLAVELQNLLNEVGMHDARISFDHREVPLEPSGSDEIKILFSANKGIAPQELAKVASGGEFSRLMFCIKYILARQVALPTVIFDEIDTGVSGEIAIKLGDMMKKMAQRHQVITISHLPQIAAKGNQHYFVYKDTTAAKTMSKIKRLTADDRISEIAKMLGGDNPSAVAFENARELLTS